MTEASARRAGQAILVASRALVGIAARSLAAVEEDVTLPQYRMLVLLHTRGDQNVGALAAALDIHASTASRLCDRLANKRFIRRTPSASNRREVTISLTPRGRAIVHTVTERRLQEIQRIVATLDDKTRDRLADAFITLAAAADEPTEDAWKLGWEP